MNMVREVEESDTDFLARLMAEGFAEMRTEFNGKFDGIRVETGEMHSRLRSIEKMQGEMLGRLDSIERNQEGALISLDETVTRHEFETLVVRVDALEAAAL